MPASEVFGRGELVTPTGEDPYRPALSSVLALLTKLGIKPAFGEFEGRGYDLEGCEKYISAASGEAARVITHRNAELSLATDNEELIGRLEPLSLLTIDLEELLAVKHLKLRFGTIEEELWDEVRAEAENERGAFLFRSGFSEGRVCCILLTLPGAALREEDRLRDFGFQPENAPNAAGLTGIPAERIVQLRQEAEDARRQAAQLTAELDALRERERADLLSCYSWLRFMSEAHDLRRFAAVSGEDFYLCGWLPEGRLEAFKAAADGVVTILLFTAGVGVVLILISGVLNIITGFRQKDYRKALFSANGVTGVLFLAGIVGCAASDALFATGLLSTGAVWFVFALLLLSIWFGEPLISMMGLAPAEHGHKTSVGMMILEGFFELFEAFLSWLSNCLSFLRVGTYAICHAIMMLIVYALSETSGGYSIFGLVIGNIIVMGIEAALVCIQALRLEFYELFGRFYTGRGEAFAPAHIDYSSPAQRAA